MNTKVVVVVGSVLVLGVGAFFYFKPKAKDNTDKGNLDKGASSGGTQNSGSSSSSSTDNTGASSTSNTVIQTTDTVINQPLKTPIVKTLSNEDMLKIQNLRDKILALYTKKAGYKKASSRNAVQSDIDFNLRALKELGYTLDYQRNLAKIASI